MDLCILFIPALSTSHLLGFILFIGVVIFVIPLAQKRKEIDVLHSRRCDESNDSVSATVKHEKRDRPSLRRAQSVGIELALNRGSLLKEILKWHIGPRHAGRTPTPTASCTAEISSAPAASAYLENVSQVSPNSSFPRDLCDKEFTTPRSSRFLSDSSTELASLIAGTLRQPNRICGDTNDMRRVSFYREWDFIVGVIGESGSETSSMKVVVHMSVVGGPGSRPRVITAFPCRKGLHRRDVRLDGDSV